MLKSIALCSLLSLSLSIYAGGGNTVVPSDARIIPDQTPSSQNGFIEYIKKAEKEISYCDSVITILEKDFPQTRHTKRILKKLDQLQMENDELKDVFFQYLHNGMGDWKVFRAEFSQDLAAHKNDLLLLQQMKMIEVINQTEIVSSGRPPKF